MSKHKHIFKADWSKKKETQKKEEKKGGIENIAKSLGEKMALYKRKNEQSETIFQQPSTRQPENNSDKGWTFNLNCCMFAPTERSVNGYEEIGEHQENNRSGCVIS